MRSNIEMLKALNMSSNPLENPYSSTALPVDTAKRYRFLANCEAFLGALLLLLAACVLCMTLLFVAWALAQGNVPLIGMIMASLMRLAVAAVCGIPGVLLLLAARSTRKAAQDNSDSSLRRMRSTHWVLSIGLLAMAVLAFGAVAALALAIGLSNM